ncbi:putative ankyrin repeat protein [Diplodia seriata]|uniref:Putative ankyrin repeat protein n=1 Tax=Diplodia seriata TaxID=420778 RepID=A0A0G2DS49_9PEZI|nr:putative ankyrin repeat protein [Diplodia seriata]
MLIKDFVAVVPSTTTETIAAATRTTPAGGLPTTVVAAAPINHSSNPQQEPITAPITITSTAQPTARPSTPPTASARLAAALRHRIGSTGSWLLGTPQFSAWETLLWLHGPTGSGKTVLASALVHHLRSQSAQRRPCLFYLFDGTDARETNGLEAMLKGFVGQLVACEEGGDAAGGVVAVPSSCGEGEGEEEKFPRVVEDAIVGMEGPLDVVVDGIDECAERAAVVRWLDGVMQKKKGGMRLCVSSRHAEPAEPCFGELMRRHGSQRIALDAAAMSDDIKAVALWALSNDARFGRWQQHRSGADAFAFSTQQRDLSDADFRKDVVDTIVRRADGIIQLVPHHLDALAQSATLRLFKRTLSTLPANLADTHARLLSAVPTAHRRSVIRLLRFALYSESAAPLTAAEATDALAVSLDMEPAFDAQDRVKDVADLIAGLCPRLLEVRGSGDDEGRVHVAHGSVREYLLSDPPAADGYSDAFAEGAAKAEMARVCMAYLAAVAGVWWRNVAAVPWEVVARAFPFAGYAARHWAAFARSDEGVEEVVVDDVVAFVADEKTRALLAAAAAESSPFQTPLSLATQAGLRLTVSALLKAQPPPSADDCTAALVHACATAPNNPTIAAALLSGGADPNTSSGLPLTLACTTSQSPALVDLLLSAGADPTLAGPALPQTLLTTTTTADNNNNNNLAVLATLLAHACATVGIAYWTPALATACEDGLVEAARLFHSHGIRLPPAQHGLLLRLAARGGHAELVALLLQDDNNNDRAAAAGAALDEALWNVAQTHRRAPAPSPRHVATLATLAAHSAPLTSRFWRGLEGQVAVMNLQTLDAVLAAIAPGTIAHGRGHGGAGNVLERVCAGGVFDGAAKARMLLARGVVDAAGEDGAAALRAACRGGEAEVAKLLVERGADPYAEGPAPEEVAWEGWANAFAVAERAGRGEIVDILSRDRAWEAEKMRRVSFHVSHSRLRNDWKRGALGLGGVEA